MKVENGKDIVMEVGMIGLGRMGSNMVQRLLRAGQKCVVYDLNPAAGEALVKDGAVAATSLEDLVKKLAPPRHVWLMVPAAVTDATLAKLVPLLSRDDVAIDGLADAVHRRPIDRCPTETQPQAPNVSRFIDL